MDNKELAKHLKAFKDKLELAKRANQHNVELLKQLKGAYEGKLNEILDEIEDIMLVLADTKDPEADEVRHRLEELLEKYRSVD